MQRRGGRPVELDGRSRLVGMEGLTALRMESEQDNDAHNPDADGDPEQVAGDFFCIEWRHDGGVRLWVRCAL